MTIGRGEGNHEKERSTIHLLLMGLNSDVPKFDFTHSNSTFSPSFKFFTKDPR